MILDSDSSGAILYYGFDWSFFRDNFTLNNRIFYLGRLHKGENEIGIIR